MTARIDDSVLGRFPFCSIYSLTVRCSTGRMKRTAAEGLVDQQSAMAAKQRVTLNLTERQYRQPSALLHKGRISLVWLGRQAIIELLDHYASGRQQLPLEFRSIERKGDA